MTTNPRQTGTKNVSASKRKIQDCDILILADDSVRGRQLGTKIAAMNSVFSGLNIESLTIRAGLDMLRHFKPKVIILDAEESNIDPLHWIKQVHMTQSDAPIILITTACDPLLASRALRAGAIAYLSSDEVDSLLADAFSKITSRERFVSEKVMQGILHGIVETCTGATDMPIQRLSDREMMVFQLLGNDKSLRVIAEELGVNIKTVSTHCNNIRRKLNIPDNQHLAQISHEWVAGRHNQDGQLASTST